MRVRHAGDGTRRARRRALSTLLGRSLWRYATPEIAGKEAMHEGREALAPRSLEIVTGTNDSELMPVAQSLCPWTRLTLSDGTAARLVDTL